MADLASSAVTINETWWEGDRWGKVKFLCRDITCVLTGQGGDTNKIPASVFGMSEIHECSDAIADGGTLIVARPSYDRSRVSLYNMNQVTDANRNNVADITDTIRLVVKGKES